MARVLFVATIPETLGNFIVPIAEHFRFLGWQVEGMAHGVSCNDSCIRAFERVWDVDWSRNPVDVRNLLGAPKVVRQVVADRCYDLIHVHTPIASFVTRWALRGIKNSLRPKIIYTAHGFHFFNGNKFIKNLIFIFLEKIAGSWTDYLVVINKDDYNAAIKYKIVPVERVIYMPGIGVDLSYYNSESVSEISIKSIRKELNLKDGDHLFSMVAEFSPNKNHMVVIRALAMLKMSNVHIVFAGTGVAMEQVKSLARDLGLTERVHMVGFRKDIPALLKASTAVILPSKREGLPRSLMEALCMGVPCIGSNIRGIRDLLQEGRGLLVKVGDVEGLCSAMAWILENPGPASAMGGKGTAHMGKYDIRNVLKMHEKLYQQALAE